MQYIEWPVTNGLENFLYFEVNLKYISNSIQCFTFFNASQYFTAIFAKGRIFIWIWWMLLGAVQIITSHSHVPPKGEVHCLIFPPLNVRPVVKTVEPIIKGSLIHQWVRNKYLKYSSIFYYYLSLFWFNFATFLQALPWLWPNNRKIPQLFELHRQILYKWGSTSYRIVSLRTLNFSFLLEYILLSAKQSIIYMIIHLYSWIMWKQKKINPVNFK